MLAVIKTGGKQYKVKEGTILKVEKLTGNKGDKLVFDHVLLVGDEGGETRILDSAFSFRHSAFSSLLLRAGSLPDGKAGWKLVAVSDDNAFDYPPSLQAGRAGPRPDSPNGVEARRVVRGLPFSPPRSPPCKGGEINDSLPFIRGDPPDWPSGRAG